MTTSLYYPRFWGKDVSSGLPLIWGTSLQSLSQTLDDSLLLLLLSTWLIVTLSVFLSIFGERACLFHFVVDLLRYWQNGLHCGVSSLVLKMRLNMYFCSHYKSLSQKKKIYIYIYIKRKGKQYQKVRVS